MLAIFYFLFFSILGFNSSVLASKLFNYKTHINLPSHTSINNLKPLSLPTSNNLPLTADGRHYPLVPVNPTEISKLLVSLEENIRNPLIDDTLLSKYSHQQQVIYRFLSRNQVIAQQVINHLPLRWTRTANIHLAARREFLNMSKGKLRPTTLPAWTIVQPEPPKNLLSYYHKAETETGIDWHILAAINLVETGMGRISGVSVANAKGPMQFLPSTWDLPGIGNDGDITDPHDSIQAAARYLVQRGGLEDIKKGLWGYNNSDYYGRAVLLYSELLRDDPYAFRGLYHWEIHFYVDEGDLWLPVGYSQNTSIPISTYLKDFPVSLPPVYPSR